MRPESFQESPSGHLLQVGKGEGAYWAFIPNPLPPSLDFSSEMVCALSDADRALGELAGLGRTLPALFIDPFIRREAVLSSRIEGTQADIKDLYAYEAGQKLLYTGLKPTSSDSDVKEVKNYVRALEFGLERQKTLPVCLRLIKEVHEILLEGVRGERATPGEFRRSQNWIGLPGSTTPKDAIFVPPPPPEMNEALDAFEKYLHSDNLFPPLVRLALIHYQFEAIHPFLDGNGRVGRLLLSILLANWNLLPIPLLYLSAFFEEHRKQYSELLLSVSKYGIWHDWVIFVLQGIEEQARDACVRAKELQDIQKDWYQRLKKLEYSGAELKLADTLFTDPFLTIPRAQKLLELKNYRTAKSCVEKLVKAGILAQPVGKYGKIYLAKDFLDLMGIE
ncbi:MAG: Fic family protein [Desulfobaccales bacterium]